MRQFHTEADGSCITYFDLICQRFLKARLRRIQDISLVDKYFLKKFIFAMTKRTYQIWKKYYLQKLQIGNP